MYEVIADYYDLFMEPGDEEQWIRFALDAVSKKGAGADVGCGSGAVTTELALDGHSMIAIDSSEQMLRRASEKFLLKGLRIPTVLQKAEELTLTHPVEFITAMCDVVNYIRKPQKFFKAAYSNLTEGGLLVFDISSEYKLRNMIGGNVFTCTRNDVTYIWENFLKDDFVDMTLTFFSPAGNGLYRKEIDMQRQYIYKTEQIVSDLLKCGFETKTVDKNDRIYFVAKKDKE